eukprot:CAMPEP_0202813812 /NCGR_PEP_ID=MMETSP1389-20130828/5074_1 /ASSEMBLY_ACC=CAM_ASM_000865 /TAXON_ID=302021 /ORGANISM="Rhodomonas sp., Strain CCMP768" /LENGTH=121 /DNA_ID=CAMNT_0049485463 /DNA_START=26 /DNA_END=388 /DNA_ORIENTATION=-
MQFLDCSPYGMRPSWPDYTLDAQCHSRQLPGGLLDWSVDGPFQYGDEDETARFFRSPVEFLHCAYGDGKGLDGAMETPTHIVVFDEMAPRIEEFLRVFEYQELDAIFHAHIVLDDRTSQRM